MTPLQKKPKLIGKDHGMTEVSKHSTSTETMFFEKVSIIVITGCVCVRVHLKGRFDHFFLSSLKNPPTGEEGSSELRGL